MKHSTYDTMKSVHVENRGIKPSVSLDVAVNVVNHEKSEIDKMVEAINKPYRKKVKPKIVEQKAEKPAVVNRLTWQGRKL